MSRSRAFSMKSCRRWKYSSFHVSGSSLKPPNTSCAPATPVRAQGRIWRPLRGPRLLSATKSPCSVGLFDFSITQDGVRIAPTPVVKEVALLHDPNQGAMLEITFHFRHQLTMKAGAQSRVEVQYRGDYLTGSENMGITFENHHSYTYILGTGRTWKGPIGQLYLAVPAGIEPVLPKAFGRMGRLRGKDVFLASAYVPGVDDEIDITDGMGRGARHHRVLPEPRVPPGHMVRSSPRDEPTEQTGTGFRDRERCFLQPQGHITRLYRRRRDKEGHLRGAVAF